MTVGIDGAESNVAIGLARLGVPVAWVGRVRNDSFGDLVLRGEGIDVVTQRDSEAPTGLTVKEQRTAVAAQVWFYRPSSTGSRLNVDDLPEDAIAEVLHIGGMTPPLGDSAARAVQHTVEVEEGRMFVPDVQTRPATGALIGASAGPVRSDWPGLPTRRDLATGLDEIRVLR